MVAGLAATRLRVLSEKPSKSTRRARARARALSATYNPRACSAAPARGRAVGLLARRSHAPRARPLPAAGHGALLLPPDHRRARLLPPPQRRAPRPQALKLHAHQPGERAAPAATGYTSALRHRACRLVHAVAGVRRAHLAPLPCPAGLPVAEADRLWGARAAGAGRAGQEAGPLPHLRGDARLHGAAGGGPCAARARGRWWRAGAWQPPRRDGRRPPSPHPARPRARAAAPRARAPAPAPPRAPRRCWSLPSTRRKRTAQWRRTSGRAASCATCSSATTRPSGGGRRACALVAGPGGGACAALRSSRRRTAVFPRAPSPRAHCCRLATTPPPPHTHTCSQIRPPARSSTWATT